MEQKQNKTTNYEPRTNKLKRRTFLRNSALLSAGLLLPYSLLEARNAPYDIGIQLYTVRQSLERDFAGTLSRLASMGFRQVELYGYQDGSYFGLTVKEVKRLLRRFNMRAPSGHYAYGLDPDKDFNGTIRNGWEQAIDDAVKMGHQFMVLAYLTEAERSKLDRYKRLAEWLNMAGQQCKAAGIQLCYHNHDFEFQELEGELPYDVLLERTEVDLLKMELDMYWITKAGYDPLVYFDKHPGRFPLWHVKDMEKSPERFFAEVGQGSIDFPAIFAQKKKAGLQRFFIEQDESRRNIFDSVQMSREYLLSI